MYIFIAKLVNLSCFPFFSSSRLIFLYCSEFTSADHRAGSPGDKALAIKVITKFKTYGMDTWSDELFVKVQDPPASGYNKFVFKGTEQRPTGFLSYSATGKVNGTVLYAYYGQESDFILLRDKNINLTGRVLLVRAGKISFAEKVGGFSKDPSITSCHVMSYKVFCY